MNPAKGVVKRSGIAGRRFREKERARARARGRVGELRRGSDDVAVGVMGRSQRRHFPVSPLGFGLFPVPIWKARETGLLAQPITISPRKYTRPTEVGRPSPSSSSTLQCRRQSSSASASASASSPAPSNRVPPPHILGKKSCVHGYGDVRKLDGGSGSTHSSSSSRTSQLTSSPRINKHFSSSFLHPFVSKFPLY